MPTCYAAGCTSTSGRLPEGVKLHVFPRNIEMIKEWVKNSGNKISDIDATCSLILADKTCRYRMCSNHFTEDNYRRDLQLELTGHKRRKTLLPNAVPKCAPKRVFVEAGTQTGSELYNVNKNTMGISTQTDHFKTCNQFVQWPEYEFNFSGELSKVERDHNYHKLGELMDTEPAATSSDSEATSKQTTPKKMNIVKESGDEIVTEMTPDSSDFTVHGHAFKPLDTRQTSSGDNGSPLSKSEKIVRERKFIVFESCIDELLDQIRCGFICEGVACGQPLSQLVKKTVGTMLTIKASCVNGHKSFSWLSQPLVGDIAAGDLLTASSILFSGCTYEQMSLFSGFLGLELFCRHTFASCQKDYLFPTIDAAWKIQKHKALAEMSNRSLHLIGDGQCDSPGHSAEYCAYTFHDMATGKIVTFYVAEVPRGRSPVAIEKVAFVKCVEELKSLDMNIEVIATDRHAGIAKAMRGQFPQIQHQFSIWHVAESVKKQVFAASKGRNCEGLGPWAQSIGNHLWWSVKTCNRNVRLLCEKWGSVAHHIGNAHVWEGAQWYHECAHVPLATDDERKKKWLPPRGAAHQALKKIVYDKNLTKDLSGLTRCWHTRELDAFHRTALKYCPHGACFQIDEMEARMKLAVMAHNNSVRREQAPVRTAAAGSEDPGKRRCKMGRPKGGEQQVSKPALDKTLPRQHEFDMLAGVLDLRLNGMESPWQSRGGELPPNTAKTERPEGVGCGGKGPFALQ